jgi:hypothetical protein
MLVLVMMSPLIALAFLWVMQRVESWMLDGDRQPGEAGRQVQPTPADKLE